MVAEFSKHNFLYPLFVFCYFYLNAIKCHDYPVFWIIRAIKSAQKWKCSDWSEIFTWIFIEYLRIFGTRNIPGGCPRCPRGTRARPPPGRALVAYGPHRDPLTYSFSPLRLLPLTKIPGSSLSLVFLLTNLKFSISLLRAPFPKLFWEIAPWYVTPPLLQLVFALVDYILHN